MELYEFERWSPTISTIHDRDSIQDGVYAMINFGIRNQGKIFDEVTFWRSDHSMKTLDEVS